MIISQNILCFSLSLQELFIINLTPLYCPLFQHGGGGSGVIISTLMLCFIEKTLITVNMLTDNRHLPITRKAPFSSFSVDKQGCSGLGLSIALVAKCDKKIIVAQDFFIW